MGSAYLETTKPLTRGYQAYPSVPAALQSSDQEFTCGKSVMKSKPANDPDKRKPREPYLGGCRRGQWLSGLQSIWVVARKTGWDLLGPERSGFHCRRVPAGMTLTETEA